MEQLNSYDKEKQILTAYRFNSEAAQHISKAQIQKDRFAGVDFKMISGGTWCVLESKFRAMKSTYETYYIEKHKFDELQKYYVTGVTALYMNYFTDNVCLIWDLSRYFENAPELIWKQISLPAKTSTMEYPNGKENVIKWVASLPVAHATYRYKFSL